MGVVMRLIRSLNDALGISSIVVTHDVQEVAQIADLSYILSEGQVVASGTPRELHDHPSPIVHQFMDGLADGPVAVPLPGARLLRAAAPRARGEAVSVIRDMLSSFAGFFARVGALTRFFLRLLWLTPSGFLRPRLVVEQVYNAGALSLVIIMTSGLFVGMVMGLQGYDLLSRIGSEDSLGIGAALTLLKELGPVVTSLLFAGRAGTSIASEIGLMRATDQLSAMEIMAVDPMRRVVLPRFLGGVISMPLLTAIFVAISLYGVQLIGVQYFGIDQGQFWSRDARLRRDRGRPRRPDQGPGLRPRLQPDRRVRRLQCRADRRGRRPCDHTYRRRFIRGDPGSRLHRDGHPSLTPRRPCGIPAP